MEDRNTLLCTDLSVWPNFGNPALVSDAIWASEILKKSLINRLLLYDQISIPTGNYVILPVLRLWLGDRARRPFRSRAIALRFLDGDSRASNNPGLREWVREADPLASEDLVKAYVSILRQKAPVDSLPVKALRFLVTTALGAIPKVGPALGAVGGFADSFLIEKLFPGRLPAVLLDGYRTVVIEAAKEHPPRSMKDSARNQPCWCGNGRKYKKCHGA